MEGPLFRSFVQQVFATVQKFDRGLAVLQRLGMVYFLDGLLGPRKLLVFKIGFPMCGPFLFVALQLFVLQFDAEGLQVCHEFFDGMEFVHSLYGGGEHSEGHRLIGRREISCDRLYATQHLLTESRHYEADV